jgi:biotin-[acetyl-CoA-carboxylase] ligase BirA-like protein
MIFVDNPRKFHRILPGILPGDLRPVDYKPPPSGSGSFNRTLGEALYGVGASPLMSDGQPGIDPGGFWTSWFLAVESSASQYDTLRRVIGSRQDLPGHVVCLALGGRDFHGQQDRKWQAVEGNLHLSLALRCDLAAAECGLALTMLPAVAAVDALADLGDKDRGLTGLGIKWVNDILVDGRKIGGVLTSARSQDGRIGSCVLGIGLNVGAAPEVRPTPFSPGVTCLKEHVTLPANPLLAVLELLLEAVAFRFTELADHGPEPLLTAYRSASLVLGREVEIRQDPPAQAAGRQGRVLAIGPDLSLTLSDGPVPVTTGRLVLLPEED